MEWLEADPKRGIQILAISALVLAAIGVWLGRKQLLVAIPVALAFLLLAAIAIPSVIPARTASQRAACISNLKYIQAGKVEWAKENNKTSEDIPTTADLFGTYGAVGFLKHRPECPRKGSYRLGAVREKVTCSFADKGHRLD